MKAETNKTLFLLFIPVLLMAAGQISAKTGSLILASQEGFSINIFLVLSYVFLILRGFIWIFILKFMELSTAYPVMSLNYVIILFISAFIFNEKITLYNAAGAVLITAGIFLLLNDTVPSGDKVNES